MELHELGIIYNTVPNFLNFTNGKIIELFIIHKNKKSVFLVNIDFYDKYNKKKTGLFNIDIKNKKINSLNRDECLEYLNYLDLVNEKKVFTKIRSYIEISKKDKELIECNNYFVYFDNSLKIKKLNSESTITFEDNKKEINNNICILHSSPGLNTHYVQIQSDLIKKEEFIDITYSTKVNLSIKINGKEYTDFGNISQTINKNNFLDLLVEPLEASLLSRQLFGNLNFKMISPGEIVNMMFNISKTAKVGEIEATNNQKRKFRYITVLNNFEITEDEIYIGDVIFSKKINEVDIKKIKANSAKYTYVSIYISSENISDAKDIAIQKINNIKNFIELVEKNSCIFSMYNKSSNFSNWNINKLFVDFKLDDQFYIYNIFDSTQFVYGSNKSLTLKSYGNLNSESDIIKYKNQLEKIIYNYDEQKNKLFNAMFWLNKSLEVINSDLYHSIIYINIAIEYVAAKEKCPTLEDDYPDLKGVFTQIRELIDNQQLDKDHKKIIEDKFKSVINDNSINKRFFSMLKRLNIVYSKIQEDNYKKIRKARNDIIHNNEKIDITQHDIIDCYIFISKVIFYKITEDQNEYI